jgi:hypothetical protein
MLVIYTDGITEAMNKEKKQFGEERLIQTIRENSQLTPAEFVTELNRRIAVFTEGAEQKMTSPWWPSRRRKPRRASSTRPGASSSNWSKRRG